MMKMKLIALILLFLCGVGVGIRIGYHLYDREIEQNIHNYWEKKLLKGEL